MEMLGTCPALTLMFYATPHEDPTSLWGEPWRAVFADRPGNRKLTAINWIIANRDVVGREVTRARLVQGNAKYPLFDGEVTPESRLWAVKVAKEVGDYYRDLFIHKLPGSLAERYVVLLVNGQLVATMGFFMAGWRSMSASKKTVGAKVGNVEPVGVTFCFTVPHSQYRRLHKLSLMSICTTWFWRDVLKGERNIDIMGLPLQIQTTMITPYPENKTARGVLKRLSKEQQADGTYKLRYSGDVREATREETLALWLQKFNK